MHFLAGEIDPNGLASHEFNVAAPDAQIGQLAVRKTRKLADGDAVPAPSVKFFGYGSNGHFISLIIPEPAPRRLR
jgi:hypothetical protein